MPATETVQYNGLTYRRYPESLNRTDRVYYSLGGGRKRGVLRLHEQVWTDNNGPIPDGYHVHHIDHDPLNNDPTNLQAMPGHDHGYHHGTTPEHLAFMREHVERIRPLASAWHGSAEGRAWHVQHGKQVWANREPSEATCEHCGELYEKIQTGMYCSNKCKSAARRASGVDNETRTCRACGAEFTVNRYYKTQACSRSCAARAVTLT